MGTVIVFTADWAKVAGVGTVALAIATALLALATLAVGWYTKRIAEAALRPVLADVPRGKFVGPIPYEIDRFTEATVDDDSDVRWIPGKGGGSWISVPLLSVGSGPAVIRNVRGLTGVPGQWRNGKASRRVVDRNEVVRANVYCDGQPLHVEVHYTDVNGRQEWVVNVRVSEVAPGQWEAQKFSYQHRAIFPRWRRGPETAGWARSDTEGDPWTPGAGYLRAVWRELVRR
jgi:hypothetical protein